MGQTQRIFHTRKAIQVTTFPESHGISFRHEKIFQQGEACNTGIEHPSLDGKQILRVLGGIASVFPPGSFPGDCLLGLLEKWKQSKEESNLPKD